MFHRTKTETQDLDKRIEDLESRITKLEFSGAEVPLVRPDGCPVMIEYSAPRLSFLGAIVGVGTTCLREKVATVSVASLLLALLAHLNLRAEAVHSETQFSESRQLLSISKAKKVKAVTAS